MRFHKLYLAVFAALGGSLFIPASQVFANGDSSCDEACIVELRDLIEAQQLQLQQQGEMLGALQQRVESISQGPALAPGGAKDQPGVVKSGNDKVKLTVSGQVNRGILISDDGEETDIFHVDNDHSSTRVILKGEARPSELLTIGSNIEVEYKSNSTRAVNQNDKSVTSGRFQERKLEVYFDSPLAGRLTVGQGSTASDGIAEVDKSGTGVIGTSDISDFAGGLLFRNSNTGALTATSIGSTFSNLDGLGRDDRIQYDTPSIGGVKVSASHATDDSWDFALRYNWDYGTIKAGAAIAYVDPNVSGFDDRVTGSFSVLHESGASVTAAGGRDDRNTRDPEYWYLKLGYQDRLNSLGQTAFAVDYYDGEDIAAAGDESTAYGAFAVQKLEDYGTEVYLGARNYELERPGTPTDDIFAVLTGARVKF